MLEKIKSKFFLRMLLFSLDERVKLKLVQYNKRLQKEININIINYKIFSGRYIVYDTKENGAEYSNYDDKIIFKGEYFLCYRLKGKKYIKGLLQFEGEFLFNNKYNGKGYDENGNVISELKNGTGKVKEYDDYGTLKFEGEYLNGKRNGKGKEYDINGKLTYEGDFLMGNKGYSYEKDYD